ncbi:MAG: Synerg-CTERM sorting domain-containing protein, partial [Fretibacterium sp.]|nr:Synerg-CTERM sorting domain-containing protein [Fretibacterium sp.]
PEGSVSEDALGNVTVRLTAALSCPGTPKAVSVDVEPAGTLQVTPELLDAAGKDVLKPATVGADLKKYTLRLTCKGTRADIEAGAEIRTVHVTTEDGNVHAIPVNKKLKDHISSKPQNPGKPDGSSGGCDAGVGGLALALAAAFLLKKRA